MPTVGYKALSAGCPRAFCFVSVCRVPVGCATRRVVRLQRGFLAFGENVGVGYLIGHGLLIYLFSLPHLFSLCVLLGSGID